jgi:drug/metabolite transporter (DMT)-like permease
MAAAEIGGGLPPLALMLWVGNAVFDTAGQLALKAAAVDDGAGDGWARWRWMAARPWIWIGVGCFVVEFGLWLAFLSLVPLSEGVLLGSINIVVIMLVGRLLFGEQLSRLRVAGILLISAGVAVVGLA